jgi:prepilin-type N-terminal cleavage/methylation domain-containing protein
MPGKPGSKRSQSGFTMIEVMVSLLLTAIAIMGILALYIAETRASGFSRHTTEAAVLAGDKVEKLRTDSFVAATGSETNLNERAVAGGIFNRTWTETLGTDYADITVTVSWTEDGVARQFLLRARRNK